MPCKLDLRIPTPMRQNSLKLLLQQSPCGQGQAHGFIVWFLIRIGDDETRGWYAEHDAVK